MKTPILFCFFICQDKEGGFMSQDGEKNFPYQRGIIIEDIEGKTFKFGIVIQEYGGIVENSFLTLIKLYYGTLLVC